MSKPILTREAGAFREALLDWFERSARDLPWRRTHDPYLIWLSEVILQQTRVDQALPYYHRLSKAFPTVKELSSADIDRVLRLWEGLGYYSRCRNLHRAAGEIMERYNGRIPDTYDDLISLPGIGPYTAAAILSIAYEQSYGVLDGNVIRVLTRLIRSDGDVRKSRVRSSLQRLADHLVDPDSPGLFNEAMMELGATVCSPRKPSCDRCPVAPYCAAATAGDPEKYPKRAPRRPLLHYDIAVGVISNEKGEMFIQRRPESGLLGGLWEFPGGKREANESIENTCHRELEEELGIQVRVDGQFSKIDHAYSHFKITLYAFQCSILSGTPRSERSLPIAWVAADRLSEYAFPRANRKLIEQMTVRDPQGHPKEE